MAAGVLFALTLPGLVVLLVVLAVVEHAWSRLGRPSPLHRRARHALSAGGLDVFSAALFPGKALDLEEQRGREVRRDDAEDGAPPNRRIDLDSGVVRIDLRDQPVPLRNSRATSPTRRLPTFAGMSTSTARRTTWTCDNCHAETAALRKRCGECGTSRH